MQPSIDEHCWISPSLLPQVADQFGVSSLHINFTTEAEFEALGAEHGYLQRTGIQVGRGSAEITGWCG